MKIPFLAPIDTGWLIVGMVGQSMFFLRFLFQWIASERARASIVPVVFWYFSIAGALMVLVYGLHRGDPVLIYGQSVGFFVYARNLWFIHRKPQARIYRES